MDENYYYYRIGGILLSVVFLIVYFIRKKKNNVTRKKYSDPKTLIDELSIDIDLNPKNEVAYYQRGQAKLKLRDRKGAYKDFCAARDLGYEKANEIIENQLSDLEYQERLQDYETYINITPGIDRMKAREYKNQFEDYTKMIESNPKSFTAYLMRAGIREIIKDHKGAIEDLNKAILLKHNFSDAFTKRAVIHIKMNNMEAAKKDFQVAVKLGSSNAKNLMKKYFNEA